MISTIDYDEPLRFRCVGGPWAGKEILLGDDETTMVFAVQARGQHWRGRYVGSGATKLLAWQDVPIGVEHSALRTLR